MEDNQHNGINPRLKKNIRISLINDNCRTFRSSIKKGHGYGVKYADFVTLSFHPVKCPQVKEVPF